ncbi:DEAD/DEAH box helicase [bacterium]|nr:DEAD/DEAH box helicase [bacterium]
MRTIALNYLKTALDNPKASFRDGQWESIEQLLNHRRMLVVQRTGWGKSMVYFLATKLIRASGSGPTLLISPLLSLMRNQLEAASRIGVFARTINSTNNDEWDQIQEELIADTVDLLLISPERLANDSFRSNVLAAVADKIGLFVIDEAHCISDWGHDFRPDYRRIVRVIQAIPSNIPVLATTATANDRVVNDVMLQLGNDIELIRGSLVRKSLKLQNITMPSPAARMAWLAQIIPNLPGSGIIYTLTQRDAERLSEWLQLNNIKTYAYHSAIQPPDNLIENLADVSGYSINEFNSLKNGARGTLYKEYLEQQLLNNDIKVLVATVALGMGFDKPDLGFVIHFQRPASVVHYYQQVGRAGRAVDEAFGILLCGEEDDHIADYFIRSAFPPQNHIAELLAVLNESDNGLSIKELQREVNLREKYIQNKIIKFLTVESPSPIVKINSKWHVTVSAIDYEIDQEYVNEITQIRKQEQTQMQEYMEHQGCLMAFLQNALDDPDSQPCGKCVNCNPDLLLPELYDNVLANRAALFLRRSYQPIEPRKQWPSYNPLSVYGFTGRISENLRACEGRALSLWGDAGWGQLVASGKHDADRFDDELVTACVEMIKDWNPAPAPEWITCIPSFSYPVLVPDFAQRLAMALDLPFVPCIEKIKHNRQQKFMENSFQQAHNLDGVFNINLERKAYSPCFLIDDMVDSRWTFTVASALLRQTGCTVVYPLALAINSPGMDK